MRASDQVDRRAVLDLVRAIASRYLLVRSGEDAFLTASGPILIDSYLDQGPSALDRGLNTNAFEWGPSVPADVAWLPVLLGTLKAALELGKSIRDKTAKPAPTPEVLEKWKQRLIEAGLDPSLAGTIAGDMGAEFAKTARG